MNKKVIFRNGSAAPARFWNMAEINGDTAEVTLYGDVVSKQPVDWWSGDPEPGMYITPEGFAADLAQIKDKKTINIKLNSCGGDLYTGIAIHNALKALPGTKNVIVEGLAASAASIIAMAGDSVKMYPGSLMMIHGVAVVLWDYVQIGDLKKIIKAMDASERAMAAIYSAKTGTDETTLRGLMEKETWMTGAEAIAKGFADELLEGTGPQMQLSAASHLLICNGVKINTEGLTIPERFNIPQLAAAAPATVDNKTKPTKGEQTMTLDELKAQHPELVAQIEQEAAAAAVTADRGRIQAIEEIQDTIGDAELVAAAKFTDPQNAADLALAAMRKQAKLGGDFMAARQQETSPAAKVAAAVAAPDDPAELAKATAAEEKQTIANIADKYKELF